MKKVVIVYHTDCDGHLSGAILRDHLEHYNPTMVRMEYNDKFSWELIDSDTEVWMADYSLQPWSQMERLVKSCKRFVWIDHHKTAIQAHHEHLKRGGNKIEGYRLDGKAACRLCWDYCNPDVTEPHAVFLAGKYDVWEWRNVPGCLEFQYGTKFYNTDPATEEGQLFWNLHLTSPRREAAVCDVIEAGAKLLEYKKRSNAAFMKDNCFETQFHGFDVIAVNRKGSSQQFDSVWNPEKHHFMLTFAWTKGVWSVSMYTERKDVDVSEIAKQHGGGGHRGAAGFSCEELPFPLK